MRFTPQVIDLQWLVARPIAHRGLHAVKDGILENTASAFAEAMVHSYAIECDVQLTADGDVIVFHDDELDRLTGESGLVKRRSTADLKAIPLIHSSDRMQTLAELFAQVQGAVPLVIELKSHWDGNLALVRRAVDLAASYDGPFCFMSFDPDMVAELRRLAPGMVRGIVADRTVDPYYNILPVRRRIELRTFGHLERTQPHFVSYCWSELPFPPVGEIRNAGYPVITWTIRSPAAAAKALRYSDQVTFEGYHP
jgi:glycerophosphoryl diester phosphodiesterase